MSLVTILILLCAATDTAGRDHNCSALTCIDETSFPCLKEALLGVNQNLKDLRAAIFQPNMPIPRYTILHYIYLNSTDKTKCPVATGQDPCCTKDEPGKNERHNTCALNSWVWTRSSVYLLISPGALDYLSFQSVTFIFTAIPRLNKACICLPKLCNDSYKPSVEKILTSKVYRYLSQPDSLDPSDNLDGNFMEYKGTYRVTVPDSFADEHSQYKVHLVRKIRIILMIGIILYGVVVFPLLSVGVTKVFRVCAAESSAGSLIHWAFLWSSAAVGFAGLGLILYSDFHFIQNSIEDAQNGGLNMAVYYSFLTLLILVYLVLPAIGHVVIAVRAVKEPGFPLAFPLDVVQCLVGAVWQRGSKAMGSVVQGILLWTFLLFFQIVCYRMVAVFFAAFSGPLIVWGNFAFILSLAFTISCGVTVPLIFLRMVWDTLRRLQLSHAKQYVWPLLFALGCFLTAAAVSEVTYIITGLGYYEKHSFSDSFQTVVNFVAQAIMIGLIGYSMKVALTKMDHATARALNIQPALEGAEEQLHLHVPASVILPIFPQWGRGRGYGALQRRALARDRAPLMDDHAPLMDGHTPLMDDHAPLMDDHAPLMDDHTPLMDDHAPLMDDHAPLMDGHIPFAADTSRSDERS